MSMRPLIGLGLVLVLRATTPAMAQPAAPAVELPASTDAKAESHRLYDAATADYTIGRFDQALAGYEAAYQLFKAPQFLFNMAQCHFQLQHWDRAVFFFEGYLRELPDASNRSLVEDLMREARARQAAELESVHRTVLRDREHQAHTRQLGRRLIVAGVLTATLGLTLYWGLDHPGYGLATAGAGGGLALGGLAVFTF